MLKEMTRQEWEAFLNNWGFQAKDRLKCGDVDVLIAEGQRIQPSPHSIADKMLSGVERLEELGPIYYATVWALDYSEKVHFGRTIFLPFNHNATLTKDQQDKERIALAYEDAVGFLDARKAIH